MSGCADSMLFTPEYPDIKRKNSLTFSSPSFIIDCPFYENAIEARDRIQCQEYDLLLPGPCNLHCKYCFSEWGKEPQNSPCPKKSFDDITDIIRQNISAGLRKVRIKSNGEPTLYPRFWDLIDFINLHGGQTEVYTNSFNNTAELSRMFAAKNVNIVTKLDALTPEINDYLTGVTGSFTIQYKAVFNFIEAGYTMDGPKLGLHAIICKQNYGQLPRFWRFCRDLDIIPYFQIPAPPPNRNNPYFRELCVDRVAIHKLFEQILRIDKEEYGNSC
ncbi:MAG: radical SAM protein [Desulfobacteraceae bacterium]|nr:MAG: radical SAM protein [Desulfobacteraceae bacterium]